MRNRTEIVEYTSKSGKTKKYKVKARTKDKKRLLLQSYGKEPVEFWVDAEKTKPAYWDDDDDW